MQNMRDLIISKCENATGNVYDVYYALYKDCLYDQQYPELILKEILLQVQNYEFEDDKASVYVDPSAVTELQNTYFVLLKAYIRSMLLKNPDESEFYHSVYKTVFQSDLFPQDEISQSILLYFLGERIPGIPYFQPVNLLEMTPEEYREAVSRLKPQTDKIIDILNRRFRTRSAEASQIYEVMSSLESREDKIVFLAIYTNIIQRNADKHASKFQS